MLFRRVLGTAAAALPAVVIVGMPCTAHAQEATAYLTPPRETPSETRSSNFMGKRTARLASREGNIAFLALGVLLPYLEDNGKKGQERSLRVLDALVTGAAVCQGLKWVTREERPDGSNHESFPSGHATGAFAVAAMQARYHPDQAPLWYAGASVIGASRVRLDRHFTHDVLVGGLLGVVAAEAERRSRRGLILSPIIAPSLSEGGGMRLGIGGAF